MEDNKVFLKIWRFNAVIIASVGVIAILGVIFSLLFAGISLVKKLTRDLHRNDIVNIEQDEKIEEKFYFQPPEFIGNTNIFKRTLYSSQNYAVSSYQGKGVEASRNIMFFDMGTQKHQWLLPKHDYLITDNQPLYPYDSDENKRSTPLLYLYRIVKQDTNGDNRLTYEDNKVVAMSNIDGTEYKDILTDVEHVLSAKQTNKNTLYLAFSKKGTEYVATIDMQTKTVTRITTLPPIKQ